MEFDPSDEHIDAAIDLDLSFEKREILARGTYSEALIPSINQTSDFVNFIPMFANFAVKRQNTDRDPMIQLGAWIGAEFAKRKTEGYSLDMPVLGIEIEGDAWNLYMVFATEDIDDDSFECKFVGPLAMGTTTSEQGVYSILDKLRCCADWGIVPYQKWFEEQVLCTYRQVATEHDEEEEQQVFSDIDDEPIRVI